MAQKQKIMLIEDSDECREILATMIRLMGYEVVFAGDTAHVIVVYLDYPEMRTVHTIRALRDDQQTKDTPIIVFLPWTYEAATRVVLDAGADDVFDGPLKIETLQAGITKYAPHASDPSETTHENQPPTADVVELRVA
jgi:DNA-binding response OmpR family regulator